MDIFKMIFIHSSSSICKFPFTQMINKHQNEFPHGAGLHACLLSVPDNEANGKELNRIIKAEFWLLIQYFNICLLLCVRICNSHFLTFMHSRIWSEKNCQCFYTLQDRCVTSTVTLSQKNNESRTVIQRSKVFIGPENLNVTKSCIPRETETYDCKSGTWKLFFASFHDPIPHKRNHPKSLSWKIHRSYIQILLRNFKKFYCICSQYITITSIMGNWYMYITWLHFSVLFTFPPSPSSHT